VRRLSDVADARLGKMLDAQKNKGEPHPYLRNPNVRWFDIDLSDLKYMPFEDNETDKFAITTGDVLVCEGGEAGRAAIWSGPDSGVKFQKAIHRVRCGPLLHNRFLVHRLMYDYFSGRLDDYYTGATIKHLTGQDLARYEIPLPPLDEQRRIAAILDQADALRRKRRDAITELVKLAKSSFNFLFGDPVSNPKGWPMLQLGDVGELERGVSKHRPRNEPALLGGKHPLIQTGDIANAGGVLKKFSATYSDLGLKQSRMWPRGTLCITIAANIGKTAILDFDACFPDSVVGFSPGTTMTSPYVQYWMESIQEQLEAAAPESAQKNINLAILRGLPIPVPPIELQHKFEGIVWEVRHSVAIQQAHAAGLDLLFASLQHRALNRQLKAKLAERELAEVG
jgi:type I restriction enzyme S subunit